jgi:TadE-like protein
MKPRFSRPTRLAVWMKRSHRGQALVEVAMIAPVLLLLIGGIGDLGRAFYYKIAVENVAREAAHWATLSIGATPPNSPPIDDEIYSKLASPSQESFGVSLQKAPDCVRNSPPPLDPNTAANPPGCGGVSLPKGKSWLFIYPPAGPSPCPPSPTCRSAVLPPGAHWSVVASNSQIVNAPPPGKGGVAEVLKKVAGSLVPIDAYAATCYSWTGVSATPSSLTMPSGTPPYTQTGLTVDLIGVSGDGNAGNTANVTVTAPAGVALAQSWQTPSNASTGLINPQGGTNSDKVDLSVTQNLTPGTYIFTVTVKSTGGGCSQADKTTTFTWTIPTSPSPSPSPSVSPSPAPTPSASPPPSPPPLGGNNPNGAQITCTVIYYFTPVTPILFSAAQAIYIVGTATLQATY